MGTIRLLPAGSTLEQAEEIRRVSDPVDYAQSILSEAEFSSVKIPTRKFILSNVIMQESINIVNGYRGYGKSWLVLAIANEVTWGGGVGPWKVETPVNTLVIDGEMPMALLQERLGLLNKGRDIRRKPAEMFICAEAYAYRIGLKRASLLDAYWRRSIHQQIEERGIRLLVLDNLSSLAPGIDENDKMEFDPVNRWLLELRYSGVAIIMTHHTGKSGEQRGTSAHEDHVDLAALVRLPRGYQEEDGCKFIWKPKKDRAYITKGKEVTFQLGEDEEGKFGFQWLDEDKLSEAIRLIQANSEMTAKAAEKAHQISERTYYRAKDTIKRENG